MNKPNTTGREGSLDIEHALESIYTAPAPATAFVDQLEQQLLTRSKPARSNRIGQTSWVSKTSKVLLPWAAGFAALALLLAGALILVTRLSQPQPVSAQEIIQKAQASLQSPAAGGVQSYVLSETQRSAPLNPRVSGLSQAERTQVTQSQTQRWYQAPNRWRNEYTITTLDAQGKVLNSVSFTQVSDGTGVWQYSPADGTVTINRLETGMSGMAGLAPFGENVQNLSDLFQRASTCYDAKVTGDARVAGRETYVIDMGPSLCPSADAPEMNGKLMIWVDKETFFVLKQEQYSTQGDVVVMSSEVQQVQYNITIDPGQFTPPSGAQVQDMRPKPTPNASQYQAQLGQLAGQLGFPLFAPGYVPQGLGPLQPYQQALGDTLVTLSYVPQAEAAQNVIAGPQGISIQQQRATDSLVAQWTEGAQSITLTAGTAWLRRGVHNADGTGSDSSVLVVRDGTLIAVSSFQVTPEELIKVADSLQPVAGGHAPLPNPTLPTPSAPTTATSIPTPAFNILRPSWLPEPMTVTEQVEGEMITLGFDPHPNDPPHAVMTLMERLKASISAGGSPDPQARQEQIAGHEVTIIYRGQNCTMFDWDQGELHLTLSNAYDPPGQLRYTCEQMRKVVESIR
jgi:outer membrane lipoprotein-sorting protein